MDECNKEGIKFVEAGEDAAEAFEAAKEPFDFVAAPVEGAVVGPGVKAVGIGRDDDGKTQFEGELAGFVTLVGAIHDQWATGIGRLPGAQQFPSLRSVPGLARRQAQRQRTASTCGNQMNFGG